MARRIKMSPEERKRRDQHRKRLKRGWYEAEISITEERWLMPDGSPRYFNCLLPFPGAKSAPPIDTRLVPPERKPRRKPVRSPKRDPLEQPQMDFGDKADAAKAGK
jgi:hypothetical protein